ncbi:myosin IF [Heterostelium album PN500]|uniref:Myosin IF n=1 Tax=Heterostelium pallidum (strain ATCC 26659 / Pp 5 / PN500) TaxID=670386 RepID=D3AXP4_HETP5|nr:myosin IF [Heterostelium album PN500]EFA85721.1 myosin IF [Heterostelium album PN500]|eukprot:XP_020437827.1 myosin IF [Heterostelium album PN500]
MNSINFEERGGGTTTENHDDLCYLEKINEQSILDNMQHRFNSGQIYTRIGEQIISINPFNNKHVTEQKDQRLKQTYRNKYMYEMSPHIYQLAEDTYKKMLQTGTNQCIIITGESGSGKTEASKIVMDYISHYHPQSSSSTSSTPSSSTTPNRQRYNRNNNHNHNNQNSTTSIMKRILDSNILLEAFGNAKTQRNENSSRFGKYITIQFDAAGVPLGGKITQFLLEKSRIHSRAAGERNFHIFYQLLTNQSLVERFKLNSDPATYNYLGNDSGSVSKSTVNDRDGFQSVLNSLESLGWSTEETDFLWRILCAVLLIGNLEFEVDTNKNVDSVFIASQDTLLRIAQLLECDASMLEKALISRSLTTEAAAAVHPARLEAGKHPNYESSEMEQQKFTLKHYAGPVTYDLEHFIAKNRDPLNQDILATLQLSNDPYLSALFPSLNCSGNRKIPTMAGHQFKQSINELIASLQQCQPHYIRCIKSNDEKQPSNFNQSLVRNQIRYLNIVETVRVRKAGYCQKYHYTKFFSRYKICCPTTWNPKYDKSVKEGCNEIIKSILPSHERQSECFFGVKKIFIKSARVLYLFEKQRQDNLPKAAIAIQRVWRGYLARCWFKKELEKLKLQKEEIQRQLLQKRSAVKISEVYYRYKMRSLIAKLAPWTQAPYYNKGRQMPTLWRVKRQFDDYLVLIQRAWWAHVKVAKLTAEQRSLIRQKVLALDLFGGGGTLRKKEWDPKRRFLADYLNNDSNPKKAQYVQAIQSLFPSGDDKEILFADNVIKVNKRGKCQLRTLIITDQHIYKYDPKKYTRKKVGLKIHLIVALSSSSKRDTFLAIHFKPPVRDLFIDLGCDAVEKVSEVATILVQQVFKLTKNTIPLLLREPVTFNNSRDSRNSGTDWVISFSPYAKKETQRQCTFTKGKTNAAIVYYQESE